jgi:hypothetical protein
MWLGRIVLIVSISAWIVVALAEIIVPAHAIRWRRRILMRKRGRFGAAAVGRAFDGLTGEDPDPQADQSSSTVDRVRVIGLINLLLAATAGFVFAKLLW